MRPSLSYFGLDCALAEVAPDSDEGRGSEQHCELARSGEFQGHLRPRLGQPARELAIVSSG